MKELVLLKGFNRRWLTDWGPLRHFHHKHVHTNWTSKSSVIIFTYLNKREWLICVVSLKLRFTLAINQAHHRHMWVNVVILRRCPVGHQAFQWVMHKKNVHLDWVTVKSTASGVMDRLMPSGRTTNAMLSHLNQGIMLINVVRIKGTLTLVAGIDRGPFVTLTLIVLEVTTCCFYILILDWDWS